MGAFVVGVDTTLSCAGCRHNRWIVLLQMRIRSRTLRRLYNITYANIYQLGRGPSAQTDEEA